MPGSAAERCGKLPPPGRPGGDGGPYLHLLHLVGHVVQAQVIGQGGGVQPVPVGQEELGASVGFPAAGGRAALQRREMGDEAGAAVGGEAGRLLALPVRPSALLLAGGRRRRLVERVDGEGVPEVRVGVAGLGVRQRLVRGWEVGGLEVGGARVGERRSRAVQVLADRREVGEPRVPVAAPIVPVLESTEGWGERGGGRQRAAVGQRRQPGLWGTGRLAASRAPGGGICFLWGRGEERRGATEPSCSCPGSPLFLRHVRNQPHFQERYCELVLTAVLITTAD